MNDFDTLVSRVEQIELPPGTREKHLARISQAMLQTGPTTPAAALPAVDVPVARSHSLSATVLAGAAVVAILAGAWLGFSPDRPAATTPPLAATGSAPSSQGPTTSTKPGQETNVLTGPGTAAELAGLLHIPAADAAAGLTRLAALADRTGGALDPANSEFQDIAGDLGVSPSALDDALVHIKASAVAADPSLARKPGAPAGGNSPKSKTLTAADTGSEMLTAPETVAELASLLHVSTADAKSGLVRIAALAQQGGGRVDPTTAAFRVIAASLGSTPANLEAALTTVKASAGPDASADKTARPANSAATAAKGKAPASSTGDADLLTDPTTATRLAQILNIPPAAARAGLTRLAALAQTSGGLSPRAQKFRDIATDLHVTSTALNDALGRIKNNN